MDINALLQMLQQKFGQSLGGQQSFAGGGGMGKQNQFAQQGAQMPQMGIGQQTGSSNPVQMIMQMMQRGQQGGGMGRQMNLG